MVCKVLIHACMNVVVTHSSLPASCWYRNLQTKVIVYFVYTTSLGLKVNASHTNLDWKVKCCCYVICSIESFCH